MVLVFQVLSGPACAEYLGATLIPLFALVYFLQELFSAKKLQPKFF